MSNIPAKSEAQVQPCEHHLGSDLGQIHHVKSFEYASGALDLVCPVQCNQMDSPKSVHIVHILSIFTVIAIIRIQ